METPRKYFMKECGITELDDIYTLHYSELFQWMEQYASQQTAKLKKDLKNAKAKFEKMELTAFNLEKKVAILEELVNRQRELVLCLENSNIETEMKNELRAKITELEKQIKELC